MTRGVRHLLDLDDLAPAELSAVLALAQDEYPPHVLAGRGVALVFQKPSARTRNSSEVAVFQLGGHPVSIRGDEVGIDTRETAEDVCRALCQYHSAIGARVLDHAVLERMAAADSPATCAPLIYGYVSYSRSGAHGIPIAFGDLAPLARGGPRCGSVLGGTGIAVSAHSPEREAAMAFARWVADAEAQRGPYLGAGGQPAHRAAWEDPLANRDSLDFFRNTRATLEGAWVRPRHPGYMPFQIAAAQRLNEALATRAPAAALIAAINRLHREISS